jgi:hypothetical protein
MFEPHTVAARGKTDNARFFSTRDAPIIVALDGVDRRALELRANGEGFDRFEFKRRQFWQGARRGICCVHVVGLAGSRAVLRWSADQIGSIVC